jgi:hypothetical protein
MTKLKIAKPKRHDNSTFLGEIYLQGTDKKTHKIVAKNVKVLNIKHVEDDQYIYMKHKDVIKNMCEITSDVIESVKGNCDKWFKTILSEDLIEDYYINPIMYDKDKGRIIKLKVLNNLDVEQIPGYVDMNIELKYIKFYKQKFILEWNIILLNDNAHEGGGDIECATDSETDDDDVPSPYNEELEILRQEYINRVKTKLSTLLKDQNMFEENLRILEQEDISVSVLSRVCDDLDKLFE